MNLAGADCPLLCRQNPNIISPKGWVIGFVVDITTIARNRRYLRNKAFSDIRDISDRVFSEPPSPEIPQFY